MENRTSLLLSGLSRDDLLIEIGPSYQPLAPKSAGWRTTVVDHAGRSDLVAKYARDPSVDTARIEDVDVIWTGGPLEERFPAASLGSFGGLIASHVLEHMPDPIAFFKAVERLLDRGRGTLRLALPDKRLCFDVFRPTATTGRMLAAHRSRAVGHSYADLFDHVAYLARLDGRAAWTTEPLQSLALDHTLDQARHNAEQGTSAGAAYIDCHAWQFTPTSFELLVLELTALGEIDWQIDWIKPQPYTEFLVSLSRPQRAAPPGESLQSRRAALLKGMLLEIRDLADRVAPDAGRPRG
ncbi:MAG: methyltransferase type 11 [Planctomycetia bacterium]